MQLIIVCSLIGLKWKKYQKVKITCFPPGFYTLVYACIILPLECLSTMIVSLLLPHIGMLLFFVCVNLIICYIA